MIKVLSNISNKCDFFSWSKSVRNTFNIKNKGYTSKNPFLWWEFGLQLSGENVSVTSVLCFVTWTFVDILVYLKIVGDHGGSTVNNWHDRELLLWS